MIGTTIEIVIGVVMGLSYIALVVFAISKLHFRCSALYMLTYIGHHLYYKTLDYFNKIKKINESNEEKYN